MIKSRKNIPIRAVFYVVILIFVASSGGRSLAVGHISDFQIDPNKMIYHFI